MLDCIYIYQDNRWQHSFIYCNHLYVKKAHAIEPYIYYIIPKVRNKFEYTEIFLPFKILIQHLMMELSSTSPILQAQVLIIF